MVEFLTVLYPPTVADNGMLVDVVEHGAEGVELVPDDTEPIPRVFVVRSFLLVDGVVVPEVGLQGISRVGGRAGVEGRQRLTRAVVHLAGDPHFVA